ncbi:hypothetical protein [Chryseobacterium piperi]|nr:hypothetical protein [Chryseobacterium piperi]
MNLENFYEIANFKEQRTDTYIDSNEAVSKEIAFFMQKGKLSLS